MANLAAPGRCTGTAVLSGLGVLTSPLGGGIGGAAWPLGLGLDDRRLHGLDDGIVFGPRLEEELEQDRPLELLERVRDLVAGAAWGIPLRDDAARVRYSDAEVRGPYLAFPDDVTLFHVTHVT